MYDPPQPSGAVPIPGATSGVENETSNILRHPASLRERRFSWCLVGTLLLASIAAVPFSQHAFAAVTFFIPAFAGTTGTTDALTAALLFSLYRIDGSRTLLATAVAYLINALLIGPYAAMFPGVIDAHGFIGNQQSSATLWLLWHTTFAVIVAAGMLVRAGDGAMQRPRRIAASVGGSVAFAACAVLTVTVGRDALPPLVHQGTFFPLFTTFALAVAIINVTVVAFLVRKERTPSILSRWLIVALLASAFDTGLNAITPVRFSAAWYVGKVETFVSASIVLVALMAAWSTLYSRSAALAHRLTRTLADGRRLQARLTREHEIAAALQHASLPSVLPAIENIALHATYRPAVRDLSIGGDWYDAFIIADGRLAITIGDVAGHGLAASIVMSKLRQSLRLAAGLVPDPSTMLAVADTALRSEYPEMIATAFVALIERESGQLRWGSAGHPPAMLRRRDGAIRELGHSGPPLGMYSAGAAPANVLTLEPGSLLVAYTDGLVEYDKDVLAGLARLRATLAGMSYRDGSDPATLLFEAIVGDAARDDVAVITLAFRYEADHETGIGATPKADLFRRVTSVEPRAVDTPAQQRGPG